jgi:hypothetical protein
LLGQPVLAAEYYDQYGLTPASAELNLGIQPHGYPSGVISAVMSHDRIMQNALARLASPLKMHPFQRGADMLSLLADQRLEAGLLGDVPTILTAARPQLSPKTKHRPVNWLVSVSPMLKIPAPTTPCCKASKRLV